MLLCELKPGYIFMTIEMYLYLKILCAILFFWRHEYLACEIVGEWHPCKSNNFVPLLLLLQHLYSSTFLKFNVPLKVHEFFIHYIFQKLCINSIIRASDPAALSPMFK